MESIVGDQAQGLRILTAVRQGAIPAEWRVISAHRRFFVKQSLSLSAGVVIMLGVSGLLLAMATDGHNQGVWYLFPLGIGMLILSAIIVAATFQAFRQIVQAEEQKLIFMPNGVVQYGVATVFKRSERVIFYEHVATMQVTSQVVDARAGQRGVAVAVTPRDGPSFDWAIDDRFGPKSQIGAMIAAAFAPYQSQPTPR
ncbi:MAG: hypothetical protein H0X24_18735 [Ktedonobacterales bacterium]|nr:hypothetical protein [Ktedonobacterales bacterium]